MAYYTGSYSSTISGPTDVIRSFVAKLTADGIFAKEIPCPNIALRSQYTSGAGKLLTIINIATVVEIFTLRHYLALPIIVAFYLYSILIFSSVIKYNFFVRVNLARIN